MTRLAGKVAVVTGIGAGIGQGIALAFARQGAQVVGCDINVAAAQCTIDDTAREGLAITSVHPCNLTDEADVQRLVDHARALHGRIDILVNAAAIAPHMAPTATMDYEGEWTPTMRGEVDLVFLLCKAAWPLLKESGAASIINFGSVNAYRGSAIFGMVAHCAGKGAVLAMTRQLAVEGGPFNIRANTISPALIQTAATAKAGATQQGDTRERLLQRMLIKRLGTPEDIANCAIFLGSDESGWITGTDIGVNGGVLAN